MEELTSARFFRKPCNVGDLQDETPTVRPSPIEVAKVVELSDMEYQYFTTHLLVDAPFIAANRDLMAFDGQTGVTHCLLVTAKSVQDGVLVDSQGYDYARYAAHVPDKSRLKLPELPAAQQNQKQRHRRSGQER
ncbi:MAG: hypothetical protein EOM52_07980 [Clostridia bacterium]|nr:hypothetical protein [Clostridia bacterium]